MYRLISKILFRFSPERIHNMTMKILRIVSFMPLGNKVLEWLYSFNNPSLEREIFGLKFKNPVGFAAGFDKNGDYYNTIAALGFGFMEIGSLTPEPQPGNPKPRIFRLIQDKAIINRMGINNKGVKYAVGKLQKCPPKLILGGNIAKNTTTPNDDAAKDYEKAFSLLYDYVDYFVINVSCPNVKDLTSLQNIESTAEIIDHILELRRYYDDYRPILIKVSPDISTEHLDSLLDLIMISGIDGIVATNTTRSRENLVTYRGTVDDIGNGGLSGAPLFRKSIEMVRHIHAYTKGILPIIGVGGIMTPSQAKEMLDAGASLIQIYTGYIYNGPGFVKRILKMLSGDGNANNSKTNSSKIS
ncbi:MAG: quinone-dependent dihydroorotate dehydrogenase [Alistipes sp.]|nr:quinone-dependent dihydroorotate dehydrogenase [Candidatus Minthomonas equi]